MGGLGVRCEGFDRTLSLVLKTLSVGAFWTFSGANGGSMEPLGLRWNLTKGSIESCGVIDRALEFFGGSPMSGRNSLYTQDGPSSVRLAVPAILFRWFLWEKGFLCGSAQF